MKTPTSASLTMLEPLTVEHNKLWKILQTRHQHHVNWELADVQARFIKGRGTRDQIATILWITEKASQFQKNICFCFIDYTKAFDSMDHNKLWIINRWEYQTILPASWEMCIQVNKEQLELDMNNRLIPNSERSMSRLYIVTLLI